MRPLDVLFFRDNRPYDAGESFGAQSVFPLPSTVYGAIRTSILFAEGIDLKEYAKLESQQSIESWVPAEQRRVLRAVGTPATAGSLRAIGPFLGRKRGNELRLYYRVPADLGRVKNAQNQNQSFVLSKPLRNPPGRFSGRLAKLLPLWASQPTEPSSAWLLSDKGMNRYLEGEVPENDGAGAAGSQQIVRADELYKTEHRVGIGLTDKKVTQEGFFYASEFLRFEEDVGLVVDIECEESFSVQSELWYLGGERRLVRAEPVTEGKVLQPPVQLNGRFKLVLLTPAVFDSGWLPRFVDAGRFECRDGSLRFRLVSASIERPMPISGFDLAKGTPKPIRLAVPAGSVYYFEVLEGTDSDYIGKFHLRSISDYWPEAGFGVVAVGRWDYFDSK